MKAYWVKSPKWLSYVFRKRIWHINSKKKKKVLYLTFDDGPTAVTPFVIKELQKYNAQATFFCIGENIKKHPTTYGLLKANNHVIGNHTQQHVNGWETNADEYLKQVIETEKIIYPQNSKSQKLFRPPFGKCTQAQRKLIYKRGYQIIMWSVLSADFDISITKEKCLRNVIKNARNGSIIVFHDSEKASVKLHYVLPKVLAYFHEKKYEFKGIDSLKL